VPLTGAEKPSTAAHKLSTLSFGGHTIFQFVVDAQLTPVFLSIKNKNFPHAFIGTAKLSTALSGRCQPAGELCASGQHR
jgi:hypothetical protein